MKGTNTMKYKYNLFWDPDGKEVKENIIDKREEIINKRFNEEKAFLEHTILGGWKTKEDEERNLKRITEHFDLTNSKENMNNHKPEYKNLIDRYFDLSETLNEMAHCEIEKLMYIALDLDGIVDYKVVNEGFGTSYMTGGGKEMYRTITDFLLQSSEKGAYYVIIAHNHPYAIAAIPSEQDIQNAYKEVFKVQMFGYRLVDFIILSDCDLYSQRQHDDSEERNENTLFYRDNEAKETNFKFKISYEIFEKR